MVPVFVWHRGSTGPTKALRAYPQNFYDGTTTLRLLYTDNYSEAKSYKTCECCQQPVLQNKFKKKLLICKLRIRKLLFYNNKQNMYKNIVSTALYTNKMRQRFKTDYIKHFRGTGSEPKNVILIISNYVYEAKQN